MQPGAITLVAEGHRLEAAWFEPPGPGEEGRSDDAAVLVLLHEGLGSVSAWRAWPGALARATGCRVFAYSRRGYGGSDPVSVPRPLSYMHDEAAILPAVLAAAGIRRAVLVGHSDGGSIALLHAASGASEVRALALLAAHVFCEDVSVRAIAAARDAYQSGDLRARLLRHHGANVDCAFWGWNGAWLDPSFRAWNLEACLPRIAVPTLVIQGRDDPYGTLAQVEAIARGLRGPVTELVLAGVGHAPHREAEGTTTRAIAALAARV
jgi:pimeloyl-ACP methyl ester carboxylesterase